MSDTKQPAPPAPADPASKDELDTLLNLLEGASYAYVHARDASPAEAKAVKQQGEYRKRIHAEVQRREAAAMESLRRDIASAMDNEVMVGNTAVDVRCVALAVVDRYLRSQPHD